MPLERWSPILSGQPADDARQSIITVLDALPDDPGVLECDSDLAGGSAGYAVTYAYAAKSLGDPALLDRSHAFLDRAIGDIGERHSWPALHAGFVGVAWAAAHIAALLGEQEADGAYDEVDELLVGYIDGLTPPINYDLISGLVGIGLYALERWPHPSAQEITNRVTRNIVAASQADGPGITWLTPPEMLPDHQREVAPNGYYNLGLAHGIPGIIGFLGRLSGVGALDADGTRALEGGVEWLLAQSAELENGLHFRGWLPVGLEPVRTARVAWCYGDLGLSAALRVAGECHGRRDWENVALEIARNCAATPKAECGVRDHGLCHGSAGNAQIFNRMWHATGDSELRDAARFWYDDTLATRHRELGIGGYVTWKAKNPDAEEMEDKEFAHAADPCLLTGSAGVVMTLAAAISDVEPNWDRSYLLSSHPRERKQVNQK